MGKHSHTYRAMIGMTMFTCKGLILNYHRLVSI